MRSNSICYYQICLDNFSMSADNFIAKRENTEKMYLKKIMERFTTSESLPTIV